MLPRRSSRTLPRAQAVEWVESPPKVIWESGALSVRVNPELGIRVDGVDHYVKLYFKKAPLTKQRLAMALHLLETSTRGARPAGTQVAILDVRRGVLHVPSRPPRMAGVLLEAEANYFVDLWNLLGRRAA